MSDVAKQYLEKLETDTWKEYAEKLFSTSEKKIEKLEAENKVLEEKLKEEYKQSERLFIQGMDDSKELEPIKESRNELLDICQRWHNRLGNTLEDLKHIHFVINKAEDQKEKEQ